MYVRTVQVRGSGDTVYTYVRLVEGYREDGKNKQRVVLNLGRKDLLAPHVEDLVRVLTGDTPRGGRVENVEALG